MNPSLRLAAAALLVTAITPGCGRDKRVHSAEESATSGLHLHTTAGIAERQAAPTEAAPSPIALPYGAIEIGRSSIGEIRAFPEDALEGSVALSGVEGADRIYESDQPFRDVVSFYDRTLHDQHVQIARRTVTRSATIWSLRLKDEVPARLAVRNTDPTTVEILDVAGDRAQTPAERAPGR